MLPQLGAVLGSLGWSLGPSWGHLGLSRVFGGTKRDEEARARQGTTRHDKGMGRWHVSGLGRDLGRGLESCYCDPARPAQGKALGGGFKGLRPMPPTPKNFHFFGVRIFIFLIFWARISPRAPQKSTAYIPLYTPTNVHQNPTTSRPIHDYFTVQIHFLDIFFQMS